MHARPVVRLDFEMWRQRPTTKLIALSLAHACTQGKNDTMYDCIVAKCPRNDTHVQEVSADVPEFHRSWLRVTMMASIVQRKTLG